MKYKIKYIIFISIMLILLFNITVKSNNIRSLIGDLFNKVFTIELTDGHSILEDKKDDLNREKINEQIYNGISQNSYSLYDRFGGDIKFIPYFGETKIKIKIYDKFYTSFIENENNFEFSYDLINQIFKSEATSNNVIYKTRCNILSAQDLESGFQDPRVYAYNAISTVGGSAALGNFLLSISNFFTQIVAWFSSSNFYIEINNILIWLCSNGLTKILKIIGNLFIPISIGVGVILVLTKGLKVLKGQFSFKKYLFGILSCLISLSFIFLLLENPVIFLKNTQKIITLIDIIFDKELNNENNEIVFSNNLKNIRTATLWQNSVFEPWCNGMFQKNYNELYTLYDKQDGHIKFYQSDDEITKYWESEEKPKYNSKKLTGDVVIPLGDNIVIRNWGALAWSCQSIYHINATKDDNLNNNLKKDIWPKATACPFNTNIFIDNFRWLDAKLNISPEYYSPDNIVMNYSNSYLYKQTFIYNGFKSIYMSFILIPILILSIKKIKYILELFFIGFKLWYYSIMSFIIPTEYNFLSNIRKILLIIYFYFWYSMVSFICIIFYIKLTGDSLLKDLVYIIIGIYLCYLKPLNLLKLKKS